MKKNTLLIAFIIISATASAQVGVNTGAPYTTMDVRAKRDSGGNITDNTQLIGLQAPRLTRAELTANTATYGADQKGALIYVTDISGGNTAGQRVKVTAVGYYYFDGLLWQGIGGNVVGIVSTVNNGNGTFTINYTDGSSFTSSDLTGPQGPQGVPGVDGTNGADGTNGTDGAGGVTQAGTGISVTGAGTVANPYIVSSTVSGTNIYNANGTVTSPRTATLNGNKLTFLGSTQQTSVNSSGSFSIEGLSPNNQGSMNINAADGDGNGSFSSLQTQVFAEGTARIHAVNDTKSLMLGTSGNLTSAPIIFNTAPGASANGAERMRITGEGNVGISANTPTEKLDNNGITRLRSLPLDGATNAIYTTSGGSASASQDQTFTATKTVVADANGVMGSVNWVASPPMVILGADGVDATPTNYTISSINGVSGNQVLTTKNFTLTHKSMVTFSYSVGIGDVLRQNGSSLSDGISKQIGVRLDWAVVPGSSPYTVGNTLVRCAVPFTNAGSSYTTGFFFLNATRSFIMDAGTYGVNLVGYVFAQDAAQGVRASFSGTVDQFDIIAIPVP